MRTRLLRSRRGAAFRKSWRLSPFQAKRKYRRCASDCRRRSRPARSHVDRLAGKTAEAERLGAETAVAARAIEFVGDGVAADLRLARDAAWSHHRALLSDSSAAAFEAAMRRDDAAGAVRLANARELAAQRERAVKLAGVEAECARARADLDAAERALQRARS